MNDFAGCLFSKNYKKLSPHLPCLQRAFEFFCPLAYTSSQTTKQRNAHADEPYL